MPQGRQIFPKLSVADNLRVGLEATRPRIRRVPQEVYDLFPILWDSRHRPGGNLSGGMQQRASICRALIHEPRMLLLDEPFGALDAFTREELWCVLRDLWQAQRFNVILVTHDLREAVFLADTVYVMSQRPGRILTRKEIDLPRPRDLDLTYTEPFADLVHSLREKIGHVRQH